MNIFTCEDIVTSLLGHLTTIQHIGYVGMINKICNRAVTKYQVHSQIKDIVTYMPETISDFVNFWIIKKS